MDVGYEYIPMAQNITGSFQEAILSSGDLQKTLERLKDSFSTHS